MKSAIVMGAALAVALASAEARAQQSQDNPECLGSSCGKPKTEGGGGGGGGGSVWVAYTDDGKTLSYTDDADGDGKSDVSDNCPFVANRDQTDGDGDGVGDTCDNCPSTPNKEQSDQNGDGKGDACDPDMDGDTVANASDNCPLIPNKDQKNTRKDLGLTAGEAGTCGLAPGDACCADDDGDGALDASDNCKLVRNADQKIPTGAVCQTDDDKDGVSDSVDNCLGVANDDQKDLDKDGLGDACDKDQDGDAVLDAKDNCPKNANPDQHDDDRDGVGDACDPAYCFVIDTREPDKCLNPKAPFQVSAGPALNAARNEQVRLPLFANRNGVGIEYTWTVTRRPTGSKAAIVNPKGAVSLSRDWQYAYVDGQVPSFVADEPGDYEFQLAAKLAFDDRVYPGQREATALTVMKSDGGDGKPAEEAGGCSTSALATPLPFLALGLASLLRRRK